jgi:hypothetical protein
MRVKRGVKNNKTGGKRGEDWIFESNKLVTQVKRWVRYSHIQERWANVLSEHLFQLLYKYLKALNALLLVWNDGRHTKQSFIVSYKSNWIRDHTIIACKFRHQSSH